MQDLPQNANHQANSGGFCGISEVQLFHPSQNHPCPAKSADVGWPSQWNIRSAPLAVWSGDPALSPWRRPEPTGIPWKYSWGSLHENRMWETGSSFEFLGMNWDEQMRKTRSTREKNLLMDYGWVWTVFDRGDSQATAERNYQVADMWDQHLFARLVLLM